jgi:dephospho-CoA kinase
MSRAEPSSTRLIGLTGGIGAGKSEALAALGRLGAETLSTDRVAHELLDDAGVRDTLIARWGDDVAPDGVVDRARVASIVFERPTELAWLESELHPRVGEKVAEWRASLDPSAGVAVVEVPLLFEAGMEGVFDAVVCVVADDAVREKRLTERGQPGLEGRSERQLDQDEKAARADQVVVNDGSLEDLERELAAVLERLTKSSVR